MKIRFNSNDGLPLAKVLSIPILIIVVKSGFQNYRKYHLQVYIHECGYE